MNQGIRRRLDVVIVLCSALLGIVLTYIALSPRVGLGFFAFALIPTLVIRLLASRYVTAG